MRNSSLYNLRLLHGYHRDDRSDPLLITSGTALSLIVPSNLDRSNGRDRGGAENFLFNKQPGQILLTGPQTDQPAATLQSSKECNLDLTVRAREEIAEEETFLVGEILPSPGTNSGQSNLSEEGISDSCN